MGRWCKSIAGAIVCGSGPRPIPCRWCPKTRTKLCDYPAGKGTCNAPLCSDHATHIEGKDLDYCPIHKDRPLVTDSLLAACG